jgi:Zn-dependent protease with chaperone function
MNKAILYTLLLFAVFCSSCVTTKYNVGHKYINEVIENYSPLPEYSLDHTVFWDYVIANNKMLGTYRNDRSRLALKSRREFMEILNTMDLDEIPLLSRSETNMMKYFGGNSYKYFISRIIYIEDDIINAYALPNGEIYIGKGLRQLLKDNKVGLQGIIAHEIAHVTLSHHETRIYANRREERKNRNKANWTAALVGLTLGSAYTAGAHYAPQASEDLARSVGDAMITADRAIQGAYKEISIRRRFEYSREQEAEADIVACLFLIWTGKNPIHFIEALETLEALSTDDVSVYADHPTISFRVDTLRRIFANFL